MTVIYGEDERHGTARFNLSQLRLRFKAELRPRNLQEELGSGRRVEPSVLS